MLNILLFLYHYHQMSNELLYSHKTLSHYETEYKMYQSFYKGIAFDSLNCLLYSPSSFRSFTMVSCPFLRANTRGESPDSSHTLISASLLNKCSTTLSYP